jgi:lipopolysaccharide/colanic/teichoic acid biosynthesis glycosyltransferase
MAHDCDLRLQLFFFLRRTFDLACALAGLGVLSPVLLMIAAAVKLEDAGPVFYLHPRVGRNFRAFRLLKFRSMAVDADRHGGPLTAAGDPRVTRVGRWLRRTKLDELPQLVNVLKGEMQLVGSRPESERYVSRFAAEYAELLQERPGITDPASLAYRDEEAKLQAADVEARYLTEILPHKLALSLEHARHRTFARDLEVLLRTLLGLTGPRRALGRAGLSEPA